jgi:lipopolysaccharide/colanic/teichoic acid biosynthesis glycosyltransferase
MDVAVGPARTLTNKIFSDRFIRPAYAVKEKPNCLYSGFYYVGKNAVNSNILKKSFERWDTFEVLENAKTALVNCLGADEHITIPEVIFCAPGSGADSLKDLRCFLDIDPALSAIPLILDGSGLSEKELNDQRKSGSFDEIVFPDIIDKTRLLSKIRFLRKIRSRFNDSIVHPKKNWSAPFQNILKRVSDIIMSAALMIILSPLFLLIALAIRIESGDSVFYISKRTGKGYRIFDFYKFRTMYAGADERIAEFAHLNSYQVVSETGSSVFIKLINDPRITRVGSFLRKTSLDELPQLVNVLLGNMSFVGNRPLPLYEAETLTTDEWAKRFMAPAGMTGLWQIKKRGKKDMSAEERISLDIDYADKYNFFYDLWIIAQTPGAIIQGVIC